MSLIVDRAARLARRANAGPFRTSLPRPGGATGGPAVAGHMPAGPLTTPARLRDAISAYADLGADEVMFCCWSADQQQVDRIASVV